VAKLTINELHRALGHVAQGTIQYTVKQGLIEGVKLDSASTPEFCDACMKAKATRQPFLEETTNRAHTYGELVHMDLWGPTDNLNTTQTLEYTKDRYNVKIRNERVSPKVPPTTYVGQRMK
jgi:hypothetical protein